MDTTSSVSTEHRPLRKENCMNHERINDFLRFLIDYAIKTLALIFRFLLFIRLNTYFISQAWLRRKYRIVGGTPIHGFDEEILTSIELRFGKMGTSAAYAYTSGSTSHPKKIAYDAKRLRRTRMVFIDAFFRYLAGLPNNCTLFIFSPFESDDSLTGLLMKESGLPSYVSGLQAPHRVQNHPAIQALAKVYGDTAVRFWILTIANPGMIYATNPSTIALFLNELHEQWETSSALIKDYVNNPEEFSETVGKIHCRIASLGSSERLKRIASSHEPLAEKELFPGLHGFACWDGGYVRPFIQQIRKYLPSEQYKHYPMYSMSTEVIETIMKLNGVQPVFLPMAPGVCYEFIDEHNEDIVANVLRPNQLTPGRLYSMLVSDAYGLKRYQTEDLFECVGAVSGIPDLRFVRRRNLSYSFTGEKLTAEQLSLAFADVESFFPELWKSGFLTCFPTMAPHQPSPSYRVVFVYNNGNLPKNIANIASQVQERLKHYNYEFKSKIESRRLGELTFESMPIREFLQHLCNTRNASCSRSQIKTLPLYTKLWENFCIQ